MLGPDVVDGLLRLARGRTRGDTAGRQERVRARPAPARYGAACSERPLTPPALGRAQRPGQPLLTGSPSAPLAAIFLP